MVASAHGGVSKHINNATVFLNQTPLSVLAGEDVEMAFSLVAPEHQAMKKTDVKLTVTKSFYGDESRDEQITEQNVVSDENGTIVFNYTFPEVGYYDVELAFKDPVTGEADVTGFLIEMRENAGAVVWWKYLLALLLGSISGFSIFKVMHRYHGHQA